MSGWNSNDVELLTEDIQHRHRHRLHTGFECEIRLGEIAVGMGAWQRRSAIFLRGGHAVCGDRTEEIHEHRDLAVERVAGKILPPHDDRTGMQFVVTEKLLEQAHRQARAGQGRRGGRRRAVKQGQGDVADVVVAAAVVCVDS